MGSLMGGGRIRRLLTSIYRKVVGLLTQLRPFRVVGAVAGGYLGLALVRMAGGGLGVAQASCTDITGCFIGIQTPAYTPGGQGYSFEVTFSAANNSYIRQLAWYQPTSGAVGTNWSIVDVTSHTVLWTWTDGSSFTNGAGSWRGLDLDGVHSGPIAITAGHTIALRYYLGASGSLQAYATCPGPGSVSSGLTLVNSTYGSGDHETDTNALTGGAAGNCYGIDALVSTVASGSTATPTVAATSTLTPTPTPTYTPSATATPSITPSPTPIAAPPACGPITPWLGPIRDAVNYGVIKGRSTGCVSIFQGERATAGSISWSGDYNGTRLQGDQYTGVPYYGEPGFYWLFDAVGTWKVTLGSSGVVGTMWDTLMPVAAGTAGYDSGRHVCYFYSNLEHDLAEADWVCNEVNDYIIVATSTPGPTNTPPPPASPTAGLVCTGRGNFQTGDPCYNIVSAPTVENLLGRASATPAAGGSGIIGWLQQLDSDLSNWLTGSTGWRALTDALVAITTALDNMVGEVLGGFIHFVDLIDDKIPDWSDTFIGKSVDGAKQLLTSALCQTNYGHDNLEECWIDPIITSIDGVGTAITTATTGSVDAAATVVGLPPADYFPTANAGIVGTAQAKVAPVATVVGTFQAFNSGLNEQTCTAAPGVTWSMTFFGQTVSFTMFAGSSWFMSQFWCPTGRPLIGIGMDIAVGFVVLYKGYGLLRKPG